ncbi:uncharacterized protein [Setaria viridis]|uniref:uncharacterized protein n=1 Tax=Setaria viridis TaxID=4556 RepID=UPI00149386C1|nr:uncharacterized protein LOC117844339 [Setaria viridis]
MNCFLMSFHSIVSHDVDGETESSDDELLKLILEVLEEDEHERQFTEDLLMFGMYNDTYFHKTKKRKTIETGHDWVMRNLADAGKCYNMFRMSRSLFDRLHDLLVELYGLKSTSKSTSVEVLGMFLWMVGAPQSVKQAEKRLERSLDTVHRNFDKVLKCVVKLAADIIRPVDPEFRTMHRRLQNPRFFLHFNNCIGALDGTHIPVVMPNDKVVQHLCRKGFTTQNVLVVCDFDMRFTFVLAG